MTPIPIEKSRRVGGNLRFSHAAAEETEETSVTPFPSIALHVTISSVETVHPSSVAHERNRRGVSQPRSALWINFSENGHCRSICGFETRSRRGECPLIHVVGRPGDRGEACRYRAAGRTIAGGLGLPTAWIRWIVPAESLARPAHFRRGGDDGSPVGCRIHRLAGSRGGRDAEMHARSWRRTATPGRVSTFKKIDPQRTRKLLHLRRALARADHRGPRVTAHHSRENPSPAVSLDRRGRGHCPRPSGEVRTRRSGMRLSRTCCRRSPRPRRRRRGCRALPSPWPRSGRPTRGSPAGSPWRSRAPAPAARRRS